MAASRASSARALRRLSSSRQIRQLHLTGAAATTSPSQAVAVEGASLNQAIPQDTETLKAECRKRSLPTNGSRMDLLTRLTSNGSKNHMSTHGAPTRTLAHNTPSKPARSIRDINTSRSLKAPKDTSTVDFAIMPQVPDPPSASPELSRVPLLHNNFTPERTGAHAPPRPEYGSAQSPTITTLAADSTHVSAPSAMADVHDNNAAPVDYHDVAHRMEDVSRQVGERVASKGGGSNDRDGMFRHIWNGLVDDVLGKKNVTTA